MIRPSRRIYLFKYTITRRDRLTRKRKRKKGKLISAGSCLHMSIPNSWKAFTTLSKSFWKTKLLQLLKSGYAQMENRNILLVQSAIESIQVLGHFRQLHGKML